MEAGLGHAQRPDREKYPGYEQFPDIDNDMKKYPDHEKY